MINGIVTKFESDALKVIKELDRGERANRAKAAKYAVPKLRAAAPKKTGNLRSSIRVRHWTRSSGVGFTRPKGAHAWLVENGHDIVKNGIKVGRATGKPFFAPTWNSLIPELQKILEEPII
jgi:hypothetical protein